MDRDLFSQAADRISELVSDHVSTESVLPLFSKLQSLLQMQMEAVLAEIASSEIELGVEEIKRWKVSRDPFVLNRAITHLASAYGSTRRAASRSQSDLRALIHHAIFFANILFERQTVNRRASDLSLMLCECYIAHAVNTSAILAHDRAATEAMRVGALNTARDYLYQSRGHFTDYLTLRKEEESSAAMSEYGIDYEELDRLNDTLAAELAQFEATFRSFEQSIGWGKIA